MSSETYAEHRARRERERNSSDHNERSSRYEQPRPSTSRDQSYDRSSSGNHQPSSSGHYPYPPSNGDSLRAPTEYRTAASSDRSYERHGHSSTYRDRNGGSSSRDHSNHRRDYDEPRAGHSRDNERHDRSSDRYSNQRDHSGHRSASSFSGNGHSRSFDRREHGEHLRDHSRSSQRSNGFNQNRKRGRDDSFRRGGPRGRGRGGGRGGRGGRGGKFARGNNGNRQQPEKPVKPEFHDEVRTVSDDFDSSTKRVEPADGDKVVQLIANFSRATLQEQTIQRYHVKFSPEIEERNRGLKFRLLGNIKEQLRTEYIFDGNILFTSTSFEENPLVIATELDDGSPYNITLTFQRIIDSQCSDWLMLQNTILRRGIGKAPNIDEIDKKHYLRQSTEIRNERVEVFSGCQTTIRQYEEGPLMSMSARSRILNQQTALDRIRELQRTHRDLTRPLRNSVVITRYNNNTYKISSVETRENPTKRFRFRGTEMTVAEYYRQQYGVTIRDMRQPLLKAKPTAKDLRGGRDRDIDLVPELCFLTGLNDQQRMNPELMGMLANLTKRNPQETVEFLLRFKNELEGEATVQLQQNGITVDRNLLTIKNVRVVRSETLIMRDKLGEERSFVAKLGDWDKQVQESKFFRKSKLENWYFICPKKYQKDAALTFLEKFKKCCTGFGMDYTEPKLKFFRESEEPFQDVIKSVMRKKPKFVMMINDHPVDKRNRNSNFVNNYTDLKRQTTLERQEEIPSQCVTKEVMKSEGLSKASFLAIQVNCKLGGIPWLIKLENKGLLVMGIDISMMKDENGKRNVFSAAFAILDPMHQDETTGEMTGGKYFYRSVHHPTGEISGIAANYYKDAMIEYHRMYQRDPEEIIIYRDGVNDGDIEHILKAEVNQIKKAMKDHEAKWKPDFTFILVNKKCNARFFLEHDKMFSNPDPGTIIDTVVTLPGRHDFFLVSQKQDDTKTVVPVYYHIIHDESKEEKKKRSESLQNLTFKLTHLYYNWNGGVRVPCVCQYAKKLARMSIGHTGEMDGNSVKEDFRLLFL